LLLNPFPRYADFARLVQWRSMASGQTLFLPITNWSTNSFTAAPGWCFPPGQFQFTDPQATNSGQ
jgi:hypothetical protein